MHSYERPSRPRAALFGVVILSCAACFTDIETPAGSTTDMVTGETTGSATETQSATSAPSSSNSEVSTDPGQTSTSTSGDSGTTSGETGGSDASSSSSASSTTQDTPWDPCPEIVEPFDGPPAGPWSYTQENSIEFAGGEAVLTVTSAAGDGNVQMVLPTGFEDATATADFGMAPPADGMLKLLRIRTPAGQIVALRINTIPTGPALEAFVDPGGAMGTVLASAPYVPAMRWVRVRESDAMLHFEHSADGVTYVLLTSVPTPFDLSEATTGLAAGNYAQLPENILVPFGQFEFSCQGRPD